MEPSTTENQSSTNLALPPIAGQDTAKATTGRSVSKQGTKSEPSPTPDPDHRTGRIAILSDVHANMQALVAVLREVQVSGAERIVFLGDVVGYGAAPAECVELIRKLGGDCVTGNHEEAVRMVHRRGLQDMPADWKRDGYLAGLVHSAKSLNDEQVGWLTELPYYLRIPGAVVAHACLENEQRFRYIEDAKAATPTLALLKSDRHNVGFFGHTHAQEVFPDPAGDVEWLDETRFKVPVGMSCVVMVGAVGQPRHAMDRRASWVVWDADKGVVELRRTEYKRLAAAKAIIQAGLPAESAMRLLTEPETAILDDWILSDSRVGHAPSPLAKA